MGNPRKDTYFGVVRNPTTGDDEVGHFTPTRDSTSNRPVVDKEVVVVTPHAEIMKEGLLKVMRETDWDIIQETQRLQIIEIWKREHVGWNNRQLVYDNLIVNKSGTVWRYTNNVIASTSSVTVPTRPGVGLKRDEDNYYDLIYPRAATIVWWASIYGVEALKNPVWFSRVYVSSGTQTSYIQKDEIVEGAGNIIKDAGNAVKDAAKGAGDELNNLKWEFGGIALAVVGVLIIGLRVL